MQLSADPHDMSTPRNDPSELDTLSGFLIALQEQDKLLAEVMNANRREISVPHVVFIKGIFDKIGAFDPNLAGPFATHADPATSLAHIRDAIAKLKSRAELLEGEDAIRLTPQFVCVTAGRTLSRARSAMLPSGHTRSQNPPHPHSIYTENLCTGKILWQTPVVCCGHRSHGFASHARIKLQPNSLGG